MGGFVVMRYGVRHPGHAGGLVLLSTMGRFDIERLVEGFRAAAGDEVAELARRDYDLDPVSDEEWARVFAAFGPNVPDPGTLARRTRNMEVAEVGMALMRRFDTLGALAAVSSPTLVCVGDLDPVTPVAAAREIVDALAPGVGRLEVIEGAGHFSWLDEPKATWAVIEHFLRGVEVTR
jgi:pimeloyl-ACP methyl ester carboxylesterase